MRLVEMQDITADEDGKLLFRGVAKAARSFASLKDDSPNGLPAANPRVSFSNEDRKVAVKNLARVSYEFAPLNNNLAV